MADIQTTTWSETAGSNNAATPDGCPEGMSYSDMNNCAREIMGAVKREWNRSHSTINTAGTSTALTLTYTTAPPAYVQGMRFQFRLNQDIGNAPTLNVNGLGAKAIQRMGPAGYVGLVQYEYKSGHILDVVYDANAGAMLITGGPAKAGWQHIQTIVPTASAAVTFNLPAGFSVFKVYWNAIQRSGGAATNFGIQCSNDGGGTFLSGGTSYTVSVVYGLTTGGSAFTTQGPYLMAIAYNDFSASNQMMGEATIYLGSTDFRVNSVCSGIRNNGGTLIYSVNTGSAVASQASTNAIRLLWSDSGNFSATGTVTLTGLNEG